MTADLPPPAPPDLVALVEAYGNAERDYMLESRMAEISCRDDLVNEAREAADTAKAALLAAIGRGPPDLVKIRELVGALGALARQPGASDDEVEAAEDALLAAITPAPASTGTRKETDYERSVRIVGKNGADNRASFRTDAENNAPHEKGRDVPAERPALRAPPSPLGAGTVPTGERVPSARWRKSGGVRGEQRLDGAEHVALVWEDAGWALYRKEGSELHRIDGAAKPMALTAAQLAAEDALIAVRDEITRAVGR